MRDKISRLIKIFISKQFLVFVIVGGINTLNGLIFPTLFSRVFQANIAYVISYIPSLGISYVLNSFFTFHERRLSITKCMKFYISYVPNFLIQNIIFIIFYNVLHANKYVGIIMASALGIPVTFLILKFFTFSKKDDGTR